MKNKPIWEWNNSDCEKAARKLSKTLSEISSSDKLMGLNAVKINKKDLIAWQKEKAAMAAKILGSMTSEAKAKASRENGKKGGYHKNFKKK